MHSISPVSRVVNILSSKEEKNTIQNVLAERITDTEGNRVPNGVCFVGRKIAAYFLHDIL